MTASDKINASRSDKAQCKDTERKGIAFGRYWIPLLLTTTYLGTVSEQIYVVRILRINAYLMTKQKKKNVLFTRKNTTHMIHLDVHVG